MRTPAIPTRHQLRLLLLTVLPILLLDGGAYAQTASSLSDPRDREIELLHNEVTELKQQVQNLQSLNQKVEEIDRKVNVQGQKQQNVQAETQIEQAEAKREEALQLPLVRADDGGFRIQSANDDYSIRFGGLLQFNPRFFLSGQNKNVSSTFYINKARPIISGILGKYFEFQITEDFAGSSPTLQDAWINAALWRQAQFQFGKYKAQVSLERQQSDPALQFIQRSQLQNLVPNRDIGAQVWGNLFDKRLGYWLALMNGVPNNTASVNTDSNDAKDFVGRFYLTPFKPSDIEWLNGLGFGVAGTYGNQAGSTTSTYKTWGQSTWFKYNSDVTYAGERGRLDAQGYYYWRQLGVMAEYAFDSHELKLANKGINLRHSFTDTGYFAQIDYWLTGEKAGYSYVKPLHPFDPRDPLNYGWGAWELAFRFSNVHTQTSQFTLGFANPGQSAKTVNEYAVGLNWTLNNNIKYWFDYAYTDFYGGAGIAKSPKNKPQEEVLESQLQLAF